MNHLKLSGPESDGQDANSCNTVVSCTYHALTSNAVTDEASRSADITWLPTDAQLWKRTGQKSKHKHTHPLNWYYDTDKLCINKI